MHQTSLETYLHEHARTPALQQVSETIRNLAAAGVTVHQAIRAGSVPRQQDAGSGDSNASGEVQKPLDVFADEIFLAAAVASPVHTYGSEEQLAPVVLGSGTLALAIDPLDGSSNIETNIAVGTIFSILPVPHHDIADPETVFEQTGSRQLAAGFFVYGAQLLLVLTVGAGTRTFIHREDTSGFVMTGDDQPVPAETREYSINASNRRHWPSDVRRYIEDAEAGEDGPRRQNFGMRYVGSLVADTYRILQRGGVFLYPGDRRSGYRQGRLRQMYEVNPIAFCIEQAGGAATDGRHRILDLPPGGLHARTPFIFGSSSEVETIRAYAVSEPA